jgi:hypothetical protein
MEIICAGQLSVFPIETICRIYNIPTSFKNEK